MCAEHPTGLTCIYTHRDWGGKRRPSPGVISLGTSSWIAAFSQHPSRCPERAEEGLLWRIQNLLGDPHYTHKGAQAECGRCCKRHMHEGSWKHRGSAFTPDDSFGFFCYKKSCLSQACLDSFQEIELKVIWAKGVKARKEDPLGEISRDVIRRGCHRLGVVVSGMSIVAESVSPRTWRERQILRQHPKSTESGTLGTGSGIGTQPSRWFWCMLKFKTHHHRLQKHCIP